MMVIDKNSVQYKPNQIIDIYHQIDRYLWTEKALLRTSHAVIMLYELVTSITTLELQWQKFKEILVK